MQLIKAFKKQTKIEGMTKTVLISIETDHDDVDFSYWDKDLAKQTEIDLERGAVSCVYVSVKARFSDLSHYEGQDSLGQVILRGDYEASIKDVLQTVSIHGMVKTAIDDLIKNVLNGQNELNQFLGKAA